MSVIWPYSYRQAPLHVTSVLVTPPATEPLTLAQAKLRAGQDWIDGDPRDAMLQSFITAARMKVETDTGLALLTQTRDIYLDASPAGRVFTLPPQSLPLQSIATITSLDTSDVPHVLAPSEYVVDAASGRIGLSLTGAWPTDLRPFQPITMRLVSGYTSAALIPAPLVFAVGVLAAHYFTTGRDMVIVGTITANTPFGYEDAIAPYVQVRLT